MADTMLYLLWCYVAYRRKLCQVQVR